jgi:succinate dehydrogenase / fumarate reductase membrane anchor subunit
VAVNFETNIHKAQGLGSAKKGLSHWIIQRVTAVALIPLSIWFVGSLIVTLLAPYESARFWLSSPWAVTFSILFVVTAFYHGSLGMQVIWEDYISQEFTRWGLIMATHFLSILFALFTVISILRIFLS